MRKVNSILKELNRHIDISCVKSTDTIADVDRMIEQAKKYNFIAAFSMPCYSAYLVNALKDTPSIHAGGVVGFPDGCATTNVKVLQAKELVAIGCKEIDMVMNYSMLQSGYYENVRKDIKEVVKVANGLPVKVIIEATYLSDQDIEKACKIAVLEGATYVKSGTGWSTKPTTPHIIEVMKKAVGDQASIKAAGGIRSLEMIKQMIELGCDRFGIGIDSAIKIMEEVKKLQ